MAWSDAARTAALAKRRAGHSLKTYGTEHRATAATALRKARKHTAGMKYRKVMTLRYASQILKRR